MSAMEARVRKRDFDDGDFRSMAMEVLPEVRRSLEGVGEGRSMRRTEAP